MTSPDTEYMLKALCIAGIAHILSTVVVWIVGYLS